MKLDGLFTLSYGLYVVSSHKNGKPNGQISNAVMQITDLPPQIAIAMNKTELTHEFISYTRAFTITVLSEQTPMEYIGALVSRAAGRSTSSPASAPVWPRRAVLIRPITRWPVWTCVWRIPSTWVRIPFLWVNWSIPISLAVGVP